MSQRESSRPSRSPRQGRFLTTRWSVVQAAASEDTAVSRRALAELCEGYWVPLYAYLRRSGHEAEQARDVIQGFFARLLEKRDLRADPVGGKFRSFLLASLRHFLSSERERERAVKRGGGRRPLSLDFDDADSRYSQEPSDALTPEKIFERDWALTLIDRTLESVGAEYAARGRGRLFDRLKLAITAQGEEASHKELAVELGMTEGAINVAVHRLRKRFREHLRREIADTLEDPRDVEDEIRELFVILGA